MIVCFVDVVFFLVFRECRMIDDCMFCRCSGHYKTSCVQGVLLG